MKQMKIALEVVSKFNLACSRRREEAEFDENSKLSASLPRRLRILKPAVTPLLPIALLTGCGEKRTSTPATATPAKHEHKPPHGGTPVVLGNEEYHLELIMNAPEGKLQAFVMDGELENFVRISAKTFEVDVKLAGKDEPLIFNAVASRATGERVGDTSAFEAQADWLKTNPTFDGVLKELAVRAKVYQNAQFNFPKGNDTDEKN